jgi:hypothetical protein
VGLGLLYPDDPSRPIRNLAEPEASFDLFSLLKCNLVKAQATNGLGFRLLRKQNKEMGIMMIRSL